MKILIRLAFNNALRKKIWARIAMQLKYGVPLLIIFQNLAKQYKKNAVLSAIFDDIYEEYQVQGLAGALKQYVPYDELMLIESCESGGKLYEGFELAERIINAKVAIKKAIKSALAYPAFLFALLIVILLLAAFVLIPSFEGIANPAEWQGFGYLLYVVSSFLGSVYGAIFGIFFVFGVAFTFYSFPNYTGEYRTLLDKFPPFSIYRMIVGSTWLFTFSSMMKAGKQQVDILHDMAGSDISTPYLKDRIKKILENFGKKKFGDALLLADTGFPDEELINDLKTYAELPEFEDKLYKISEDWIKQGEQKLTEQAKIVQTLCLILITVIIISIIFAYKEISASLTKKSSAFLIASISDLMLGILAGVFAVALGMAIFYSTRSSSNVLQFQSEIIQLSSRVSSLYTGSAGYGDLTNEIAIKGGAVPKTLIKGSNLVNTWGGTVTLYSSDDESNFFIEITNIPDDECGKLAGNQVNNWISLSINSSVLSDDSSTSDVINLCNAGKNTLKYEAR